MTLKTVPVTGTLYNADGSVAANAPVVATLTVVDSDGGIVVPSQITTTTDSNGVFTLNLWPNSRGVNGSQYRVRAQMPGALAGVLLVNLLITVPDSDPAVSVPISTITNRTLPSALSDAKAAMLAAQGFALQAQQAGADAAVVHADRVAADTSAAAAAASAATAAHIYVGTYAVAPTTRPDGSAIQAGDIYFGTDTFHYVRVGSVWVNETAAAALSATNAAASANAAGTYAAAAATGAKFFDTIALGRAAVADTFTFGVKAGGSDGLTRPTIYRRDSASTQTAIVAMLPAGDFDAMAPMEGAARVLGSNYNLYNKATFIANQMPSWTTGALTAWSGNFCSDFIPVYPGQQLVCNQATWTTSGGGVSGICYYNAQKQFVSIASATVAGTPFTVPAGAVFMRIGFNGTFSDQVVLVPGAALPAILPQYGLPDSLVTARAAVNDFLPISLNLFDRRRTADGYMIDNTNSLVVSAGNSATDYIEVTPGGNIVIADYTAVIGVIWYDRNRVVLPPHVNGGTISSGVPIPVPAQAFWCRTSLLTSKKTTFGVFSGTSIPASFSKALGLEADDLRDHVCRWNGLDVVVAGDSIGGQLSTAVGTEIRAGTMTSVAVNGTGMQNVTSAQLTSSGQLTGKELVYISTGTNDYGGNVTLGSYADTAATASFYGYTRKAIETILGYNPAIRIAFLAPAQRNGGTAANGVGATLLNYVDAIKAVCADYGVPVFDQYRQGGITQLTQATFLSDGLHPNTAGSTLLVKQIGKFLESI